jgi:environmental stress-induced protein Ves
MNPSRILPSPERIDARSLAPQRWKNGGGWTRELLTWPDPLHWRLRISLATIESAGPFSAFQGVQRWITVIEGAGLLLKLNDAIHRLALDTEPLRFDGGAPVQCTPIDGPTSDLNLMISGGAGEMLRAAPGVAWMSPLPQRGLYARIAGTLSAPAGRREALAAGTLLWFKEAQDVAFSFAPDRADPATPALWLGFSA